MKIVVLDGKTLAADDNPWTDLLSLGTVEIHDRGTEEQTLERAQGAGILVVNKARITSDIIAQLPDLRFIAVTATGYDCVAIDAARRRHIPVANVPEYGTDSVAQFTMALLLELCHRAGLHAEAVAAGEWSRTPDFCFWKTPQVELAGLTIGIVGLGRIGRRVAELSHAFGMNVLATALRPDRPPLLTRFDWATLDDLLMCSDVISLHCPLTDTTAGLINSQRLHAVKRGAFLINTARGGLIVESDVADALNQGQLGGAALDVVALEPIEPDNPLITARRCLLTPHIAWASQAARRRLLTATVQNIQDFLAGRPSNVVNA
ncbi:MAG: D-2-hydroxyacid dehydrogenase [Planctomycetes bacterium]|nr:D-2-hydroxyacid dehydrogenase [Planctomycetota bacterium]